MDLWSKENAETYSVSYYSSSTLEQWFTALFTDTPKETLQSSIEAPMSTKTFVALETQLTSPISILLTPFPLINRKECNCRVN